MLLFEQAHDVVCPSEPRRHLNDLARSVSEAVGPSSIPIRLAVTRSTNGTWHADIGAITGLPSAFSEPTPLLLSHIQHKAGRGFNVALVVPTGIGSEIGGHAGDAGPAARLLASLSDTLITHPNVVNASDINELPPNGLYVEGSVLSRFLLGSIGLRPVRSNRVLVVIDDHPQPVFTHSAINSVNAARAAYGLDCAGIITMRPGVRLRARFSPSGRAAGRVDRLGPLMEALKERREDYDAVAISSVIDVPHEFHTEYFERGGDMVNPWGGVEAMLTHAISSIFDVPSAHSPMFESEDIANMDVGVVDPRMAAEAVSQTFLQCTLKGLATAPQVVTDAAAMLKPGILTAGDVSCLVIPDGCLGLPTLAALLQGIPVIAVREARNVLHNDLATLPWRPGQFSVAGTFLEAVGIVAALRAGVCRGSVQRPLNLANVVHTSVDAPIGPTTTMLRTVAQQEKS